MRHASHGSGETTRARFADFLTGHDRRRHRRRPGGELRDGTARDPPTFSRGVASGDDNGGTRGVSYAAALARDAPTFTRSVASGDASSARGASHAAVFLPAFDSSPSLWGMHLWDQFVLGVAAGRQNFTQSVSSRR